MLVVCHAAGDFLLQTDWQARNKQAGLGSDPLRRRALFTHIATYTLAFVPALVWIGLGTPKQDLWMHRLSPDLEGVLAMGVGAAFDFISGNRPRAPMWMQESGLEWVHRMVHDPIKLAPRYAAANTVFIASTIAEVTRDTVGAARPSR